jgi:hypothetical protein
MSVNPPEGTLTIENSHLDVKGNVSAVALKLGTLRLTPSYGLDAVANVSNSTTHTLELSNATTGLVTTSNIAVGGELTVSGNATVTGDLNVSGALGILDAIYPVGTVIDRATAITDTHLNGKYKAFLAAPDQEWELVSDGQDVVPLEYLTQLARTTSFCGRATLTPATAIQDLTESFADLTGTEVSGFVPVIGTKKIKYHVNFATRGVLSEFRIQFKEGSGNWQEIKNISTSFYSGAGANGNATGSFDISCILTLNDIDDADNGLLTSERPTLSMKVIGREYDQSANYYMSVHNNPYYFTSNGSQVNQDILRLPVVDIVSLGPEANLKYKRTA